MNPIRLNLISPIEAMTTPTTMTETFPRVSRRTGATPRAQVAIRVATELVAYSPGLVVSTWLIESEPTFNI